MGARASTTIRHILTAAFGWVHDPAGHRFDQEKNVHVI